MHLICPVPNKATPCPTRIFLRIICFTNELYPEDSYQGSVFWAALPFQECLAWANQQSHRETQLELRLLAKEFKKDPLQPLHNYTRRYGIPGMGWLWKGRPFSRSGISHRYSKQFGPSVGKNIKYAEQTGWRAWIIWKWSGSFLDKSLSVSLVTGLAVSGG